MAQTLPVVELVFLTFVLLLIVFLGLRSLRALMSLRKENSEVRNFYENQLAREIKNAIVDEMYKTKMAPTEGAKLEKPGSENPLAALLKEIYDDLYTRIAEEEAIRKKSLEELKEEIAKLRLERQH